MSLHVLVNVITPLLVKLLFGLEKKADYQQQIIERFLQILLTQGCLCSLMEVPAGQSIIQIYTEYSYTVVSTKRQGITKNIVLEI